MTSAAFWTLKTFLRTTTAVIGISGLALVSNVISQTATPTPASTGNRFDVTSSVEIGLRGVDVNGSLDKYKSDLNYQPGVRLFDSSFLIDDKGSNNKVFDSLLFTTSGYDSDPSGSIRLWMNKKGQYQLDSNIRTVKYFNNLNNFALNEHTADIKHHFGDVDLTIFPESEKLRFRLGYSFNASNGTGGYTTRAYSDEFPVSSFVNSHSNDFRAGVDGGLLGFHLSLTFGYRVFSDNTSYSLLTPSIGNNTSNTSRLNTFNRTYPTRGNSGYTTFSAQRTFAKRFDFTTRWIYSSTDTNFSLAEFQTGRDNSNNIVVLDQFAINGDAKRPQTRGDTGITWMITQKLRVSNTFTFDQFNISGGNLFAEGLFTTTSAGIPRPTTFTNTQGYRVTSYRRFTNLAEVDYQFNDRIGGYLGWLYSDRKVELTGFDRTFNANGTVTTTPLIDDSTNATNSLIAGMRIKPLKNWSVYWDLEHGDTDNYFTRLANYNFTNFRIRSITHYKRLSFNLSAIFKDNNNPGRSDVSQLEFAADTKSRSFIGSVDWTPMDRLTFSGGYTYLNQTSTADVLVPVNSALVQGFSQYFVRDSYGFFDVTVRPIDRVSLYISYRVDDDSGQGNRISTLPQNIISSYPFTFHTPEGKLAIRLTRHIDWNLGYQFYDYSEGFQTAQNYRAHLPYTSIRIHWGGKKDERFNQAPR